MTHVGSVDDSLAANETDQGSDDLIEAHSQRWVDLWQVTHGSRDFETGERFAHRTGGVVVAGRAISPARIASLGHVERPACQCSLALLGEIRVTSLELSYERRHRPN